MYARRANTAMATIACGFIFYRLMVRRIGLCRLSGLIPFRTACRSPSIRRWGVGESPDPLDALVWALWALVVEPRAIAGVM